MRQAGRGAECGWDGARPGPTQAKPARASRTGKMHARPRLVPVSRAHPELELQQEGKGNNGEQGVLSTPDARSICFSVVHSTLDCVQPSSHFNFNLLKD